MKFELTKEYIENVEQLIEDKSTDQLQSIVSELHAADIKDIYNEISREDARYIHLLLDHEKASDVLVELEEEDRKQFLNILPGEIIAKQYIENMDSDDAADVISELKEDKQEEVIYQIEDLEKAGNIIDLLGYKEDTAGSIMAKELVKVNSKWTIMTCLREMRKQAEKLDNVYYVYVVDDKGILKGLVSLKKMLISQENAKIEDIYLSDIISVTADKKTEEVANIMDKYDLVAIPVIDAIGRLLGRITIDDVVDIIREEAEKDYQMASGYTQDVNPQSSVFRITRARLPWLLIGLTGGVFSARIIGAFEGEIKIYPEMAFFIPLIAAMGGNVGIQSSSIIVQGLANNSLGIEGTFKKLLRELGIALINGAILSSIILSYNLIFKTSLALTFTTSIALVGVILFASLFGTLVPLTLHRFKVDPAVATGPFITTMNDIFGLVIYLGVGRIMHGIF